uniref:Uncharacterized protein n=1 Tax=Anguilla anguilla TaxID=7936 RepID=A0A0E9T4U8_ANGAN
MHIKKEKKYTSDTTQASAWSLLYSTYADLGAQEGFSQSD